MGAAPRADQAAINRMTVDANFALFEDCRLEQPVHRVFEAQVRRHPDRVAVQWQGGEYSYAALNRAANRMARRIQSLNLPVARPVALLLEQGPDAIVYVLAILKCGLVFSPLDYRLPEPVLASILDDLKPAALLTSAGRLDLGRRLLGNRLPILVEPQAGLSYASENLEVAVSCADAASIFFTSGSTGVPKGVVDSHRNLLHNIQRYTNSLHFAASDRMSLVQNPSFSGTLSTLFGALLNGATLVPFDLGQHNFDELSDWVKREHISIFHSVPSIFRALRDSVDQFPDLRLIRLEGDRAMSIDIEHFRNGFGAHCTLVNGLGATETGLLSQYFMDHQSLALALPSIPIGYPVSGVTLALDSVGEIVVQGEHLAMGYWNKPELTVERFVTAAGGVRQYRTGDLARSTSDGCLFALGRVDHRVKIAGTFVDLPAVEQALLRIGGITQAIVTDRIDQDGDRRLVAYLVAAFENRPDVARIREWLSARLAAPMVPSAFVYVDALPLSKDQKVDRSSLPSPSRWRPQLPHAFVAASNQRERSMARLWAEVLELDSIGVTDSFFDLGGDSLRAQRLLNRLDQNEFPGLGVLDVFERQTIRSLLGTAKAPASTKLTSSGDLQVHATAAGLPSHSIAVIGMSGRFPGADSIAQFWENLRLGRESISFFDETNAADKSACADHQKAVSARGLLNAVDEFDAHLFRLTPKQARQLDPQQRLWLESVYLAAEDAGLRVFGERDGSPGSQIGVFAGSRESSYLLEILSQSRELTAAYLNQDSADMRQLLLGNDRDSLATRTSFLFGFEGPSISVQTACSTSLVAIAQACQALTLGQCKVAIAGGVSISFPQKRSYQVSEEDIYSHDGHCRSFDALATGTVFGDGVGVVVLKRLGDAIAAGDRIDAVIRGWAVNNDGSNKASFTAPSADGQARVISLAQNHASVAPEQVGYVEAHGTATPIGDPIEFEGLERAFRLKTERRGFCALGSVKSNVGHLDVAAGVTGFIKAVLAVKHGEIPGTLHFTKVNPQINLERSPFFINDRLQAWPVAQGSRIAGVSSLGVGGTNCHIVLEQAPAFTSLAAQDRSQILTLSAATQASLVESAQMFGQWLASDLPLAPASISAHNSRADQQWRTAVLARSAGECSKSLLGDPQTGIATVREPKRHWPIRRVLSDAQELGFVFAGQGGQYVGMGRALFDKEPHFRALLEQCDRLSSRYCRRSVLDVLYGDSASQALIEETEFAQPVLFALEYALAGLLQHWGLRPRYLIGHSLGAYVAACVAGVFSLEDGLKLTAERGKLMQTLPKVGAMLVVFESAERLQSILQPFGEQLSIAAINSASQTVVSGYAEAVLRLRHRLERDRIYCKELRTSHAFHSALMTPILEPLQQVAASISLRSPGVRLFSDRSGREADTQISTAEYWRDHAREPIRFGDGLQAMHDSGCRLLVEIGPDLTFSNLGYMNQSLEAPQWFASLRRGVDDHDSLFDSLAGLFTYGASVDWQAIEGSRQLSQVPLPSYHFDRQRFWHSDLDFIKTRVPTQPHSGGTSIRGVHPLIGSRMRLPGSNEIRFESWFGTQAPHFIEDHRLFGIPVVPGASHFSMLAQVSATLSAVEPVHFEELHLLQPLVMADPAGRNVQLVIRPDTSGWQVVLSSAAAAESNESEWISHLVCKARRAAAVNGARHPTPPGIDLEALKAKLPLQTSGTNFYSKIWANQGGTGSAFRWIESIWHGDQESLCLARCPSSVNDTADYRLHPGLIESACQVLHCCAEIERAEDLVRDEVTYVPFSVDEFVVSDSMTGSSSWWCHARMRELKPESVLADLSIYSESGSLIAKLVGFCLRRIDRVRLESNNATTSALASAATFAPQVIAAAIAPANRSPVELSRYLQHKCAELSGTKIELIELDRGFIEMGLDSLAAVVLVNQLRRDWQLRVRVSEVLASTSLDGLVGTLSAQLLKH
jgi:amino acid adenylation domain-containing protein